MDRRLERDDGYAATKDGLNPATFPPTVSLRNALSGHAGGAVRRRFLAFLEGLSTCIVFAEPKIFCVFS